MILNKPFLSAILKGNWLIEPNFVFAQGSLIASFINRQFEFTPEISNPLAKTHLYWNCSSHRSCNLTAAMWTDYFRFIKICRGRVITPSRYEIDFNRDDIPVEICKILNETGGFPYLQLVG